jgi:hypothetical protein
MARGSLPQDLSREAAVEALLRALDNARTQEAKEEVLARVLLAVDDVDVTAVTRRRSPRTHLARVLKEEPEQETPEDEEPDEEALEDEETEEDEVFPPPLPTGPRQTRVKKLKALLHPEAKVGHKRKHRAFNEVRWEEIEAAYKVKHKRLKFKPTSVPLPPAQQRAFRDHVDVVVATSPQDINFWTEDNVKELAKSVFRYAGYAFDNVTLTVDSEVDMKNKEIGVNGRADVVITKDDQDIVIIESKRGSVNYSRGMAQMMLAAETLLAKKLKNNSPDACIYGLLTGSVGWTWMYLDSKEGRFHVTAIDPENVQDSTEKMASIAHGILLGKPIVKTSKDADSTSGKRIKRL